MALEKIKAVDACCENFDSTEGKKKMFSVAYELKRDEKDFVGGYFVNNDWVEIVNEESGIQEVNFSVLQNEENRNVIPDKNIGPKYRKKRLRGLSER